MNSLFPRDSNTGALARYNSVQCVSILMGGSCYMWNKAKHVQYLFDGLAVNSCIQVVPIKIEISCHDHLVKWHGKGVKNVGKLFHEHCSSHSILLRGRWSIDEGHIHCHGIWRPLSLQILKWVGFVTLVRWHHCAVQGSLVDNGNAPPRPPDALGLFINLYAAVVKLEIHLRSPLPVVNKVSVNTTRSVSCSLMYLCIWSVFFLTDLLFSTIMSSSVIFPFLIWVRFGRWAPICLSLWLLTGQFPIKIMMLRCLPAPPRYPRRVGPLTQSPSLHKLYETLLFSAVAVDWPANSSLLEYV